MSQITAPATQSVKSEETNMSVTIAVPVRKTRKPAQKTTAKKETAVPAKTAEKKTATTTKATKAAPAKKSAPAKKAAPVKVTAPASKSKTAKSAPTKAAEKATEKKPLATKTYIVYRNITKDATAHARKAKSFDPIRYEDVITGKTITQARKALAELKGDDADRYDVIPSYDPKVLTSDVLSRFPNATEKVVSTAKNTFRVTLRNVKGMSENQIQQFAIFAWAVDAGKKASKPTGNENMMDRKFGFKEIKTLKNDRASVTFTTN